MGARLGDGAVFDHYDRIYAPDKPELVGDDEGGPPFCKGPPALLDCGGGLGVESGLGLVQDQDRGIPEHGPCDGDALPLSAAQTLAALGEHGVEAFRQLPNKTVGPGELGYGLDLLPARPRPPVGNVLGDRRPEEQGVLRHEGQGVAQGLEGEVLYVFTVDEDPSFLRVVEAGDEARYRGLARAAHPDERDPAPCFDIEVHAAQDLPRLVFISEAHALEGNPAVELWCGTRSRQILHARLRVQEIYDALARDEGGADLVDLPAQGPEWREEQGQVGHKDGKVTQRENPGKNLPRPEINHQRRAHAPHDPENGAELRLYLRAVHAGLQRRPAL